MVTTTNQLYAQQSAIQQRYGQQLTQLQKQKLEGQTEWEQYTQQLQEKFGKEFTQKYAEQLAQIQEQWNNITQQEAEKILNQNLGLYEQYKQVAEQAQRKLSKTTMQGMQNLQIKKYNKMQQLQEQEYEKAKEKLIDYTRTKDWENQLQNQWDKNIKSDWDKLETEKTKLAEKYNQEAEANWKNSKLYQAEKAIAETEQARKEELGIKTQQQPQQTQKPQIIENLMTKIGGNYVKGTWNPTTKEFIVDKNYNPAQPKLIVKEDNLYNPKDIAKIQADYNRINLDQQFYTQHPTGIINENKTTGLAPYTEDTQNKIRQGLFEIKNGELKETIKGKINRVFTRKEITQTKDLITNLYKEIQNIPIKGQYKDKEGNTQTLFQTTPKGLADKITKIKDEIITSEIQKAKERRANIPTMKIKNNNYEQRTLLPYEEAIINEIKKQEEKSKQISKLEEELMRGGGETMTRINPLTGAPMLYSDIIGAETPYQAGINIVARKIGGYGKYAIYTGLEKTSRNGIFIKDFENGKTFLKTAEGTILEIPSYLAETGLDLAEFAITNPKEAMIMGKTIGKITKSLPSTKIPLGIGFGGQTYLEEMNKEFIVDKNYNPAQPKLIVKELNMGHH